jgi:mitogen-activated protein kinase kinase kinase
MYILTHKTDYGLGKWIKGALIGAGSFGKVYLGMDASTGLLMAVKQVELPTGSAPNQERKKSMLSALEREIELLKNLQHVNIVQYLCECYHRSSLP